MAAHSKRESRDVASSMLPATEQDPLLPRRNQLVQERGQQDDDDEVDDTRNHEHNTGSDEDNEDKESLDDQASDEAQEDHEEDDVATVVSRVTDAVVSVMGAASQTVVDVAFEVKDVVVDAVVEVEHVVEEVVEELQMTLNEILVHDNLEDPDDIPAEDEAFTMALVRGTSLLPSDVAHAAQAMEDMTTHPVDLEIIDEESATQMLKTGAAPHPADVVIMIPLAAYFILAMAVVGLSSIGPLLDLQDGVSATMKIIWRTQATSVVLFPFAVYGVYEEGLPYLHASQIIIAIIASACYASMCVLFAWSLDYTTVGNAVILSNCQAILLLLGKAIMRQPISMAEGLGALVAFGGAIFCSRDSANTIDPTATGNLTIVGDLYAILSALAGVLYLITAKTIRSSMNLYVFMFCIMFIGTLCGIVYAFVGGSPITWDRHIDHGIFGWLHLDMDRLPVELIMVAFCNILGAMGYVRAMHYFSTLVIAVATLLEPVVAELTAVFLGVGVLPGWMGWLGNALVLFGTLSVVYRPHGSKDASAGH